MNPYINTVIHTVAHVPLFKDIGGAELEAMLDCLGVEVRTVRKNSVLLLAGEMPVHVGVVLSGLVHIVKEDVDGNYTLVASASPGEIFGEALCCAGVEESPVTVLAAAESEALLLRYERIVHICQNTCGRHQKLIENMLNIVAQKNLYLQDRIEIVSIKSVRAKVLRYLESFLAKQGRHITIPFNRERLAEYLCVERSALSHELSRMKREGLIDYRKNTFVLHWKG